MRDFIFILSGLSRLIAYGNIVTELMSLERNENLLARFVLYGDPCSFTLVTYTTNTTPLLSALFNPYYTFSTLSLNFNLLPFLF